LSQPGRAMGDSPDTRRTLTVDNFQTPGDASSLRQVSSYSQAYGGRAKGRFPVFGPPWKVGN
jgi:hypothetical protein